MPTVRQRRLGGGCCDCGQQVGCNCGVACSLQCRSKQGIAEMMGFFEFIPSDPPRRYLRKTYSGARSSSGFAGANCTGLCKFSDVLTWTGYQLYTAPSTIVDTAIEGYSTTGCKDGCTDMGGVSNSSPNEIYFGQGGVPPTITSTLKSQVWSNLCYPFVVVCSTASRRLSGSLQVELTEEDTEAAAVARLMSSMDWSPSAPTPAPTPTPEVPPDVPVGCCEGGTETCCCWQHTAWRTERDSDEWTFGVSKAQTRVLFTAVIGDSYTVTVRLTRRVLGSSGPFLPYGVYEMNVTADVVHESTPWIDLPDDVGWETRAESCEVVRFN